MYPNALLLTSPAPKEGEVSVSELFSKTLLGSYWCLDEIQQATHAVGQLTNTDTYLSSETADSVALDSDPVPAKDLSSETAPAYADLLSPLLLHKLKVEVSKLYLLFHIGHKMK